MIFYLSNIGLFIYTYRKYKQKETLYQAQKTQ